MIINKRSRNRKDKTPDLPQIVEILNNKKEEDIGYEEAEAECINCRTRKGGGLEGKCILC